MEHISRWFDDSRAERTVGALKGKGFGAGYFSSRKEAAEWILGELREAGVIGVGGSVTVRELGVVEVLQNQGKKILDHWMASDPEESLQIKRAQLTCDVFLSGANAITESGQIVNMDGGGNRVAALSFGPKRVIIAAGLNKIVPDIETAYRRIREVAAPMNARRLDFKTPCAHTGLCTDCDAIQRICNASLVFHRKPLYSDISVVLIGESLGY